MLQGRQSSLPRRQPTRAACRVVRPRSVKLSGQVDSGPSWPSREDECMPAPHCFLNTGMGQDPIPVNYPRAITEAEIHRYVHAYVHSNSL